MRSNGQHGVRETPSSSADIARGLGWFSIGLGLAEVIAPAAVCKMIGVRNRPVLIRLLGLREIAAGLGILSGWKRAEWVWSRVAGDAMDLGLLGAAFTENASDPARLGTATAVVAGVTALDVYCAQDLSRREGQRYVRITKCIIINRPAEEVYRFWRNFENLPRFMNHVRSVRVTGDNRSHWVVKGPAGKSVEWDAQIITDHPNELIAWESLEGADVQNAGTVRFERAVGGRGTMVKVEIAYRPPGGIFGAKIAKLFGQAPETQIPVDLHRFKQLMETGEIARTEGQPAARARSTSRKYDDLVRA